MISYPENGKLTCGCCGEPSHTWTRGSILWARCGKHENRNPCAIEGCTRTHAAPDGRHADDQWICSDHWRAYVPPRSKLRRAYHAHFRRAKRQGWTDRNKRAFWRFWESLVKTARRRAGEGFIDEAEINRIMGWT